MKKVAMAAVLALAMPCVGAAQDAATVKKGQDVYTKQKCAQCHKIAGKGGKTAGALDGVGTKLSAEDLKAWVLDPITMAAKAKATKKPPMAKKYSALPPADIDALVAYMQSLK